MTLLRSLPLLELRSQPQGLVEGYASIFNGVDAYGDSVLPGAYSATLKQHMGAATKPAMLWSHQHEAPIGSWEKLEEDTRGLKVVGRLNLKTTAGREAFEHLRAGDVGAFSIGYMVPRDGFEVRGDVRYLKKIDLREISVVTLPADPGARVTSVKSLDDKPATVRQFEQMLQAQGFTRREAARIATKGFSGFEPDLDAGPDLTELRAALLKCNQIFKDPKCII